MERITSRKSPVAAHLKKLGASRSYRRERGEFLCDGKKLLDEALAFGGRVRTLLLADGAEVPDLPADVRVLRAPDELLRWVSPLEQPQALLFSCAIAAPPLPERLPGTFYAVLDGLQDPGNVGTILRTAAAFGADGVFLTGNCADPWNPKTVRATMGAVFRLPVWQTDGQTAAGLLREAGIPLYGAALKGAPLSLGEVDLTRAALAVGSEGSGLSPALLALCDAAVRIPMEPGCESLNAAAAAAVLFWERYRAERARSGRSRREV